jgi:hypothetical protein
MTGSMVNERLQKIILKELYKKRNTGEPVILNDLWKKHIQYTYEMRATLQYLFRDKEYIWSEHHRDIGNTISGEPQTLSNVVVRAKITEKGIDYYRKEYRDEPWKYWGVRLGVLAIVIPAIFWLIQSIQGVIENSDPQISYIDSTKHSPDSFFGQDTLKANVVDDSPDKNVEPKRPTECDEKEFLHPYQINIVNGISMVFRSRPLTSEEIKSANGVKSSEYIAPETIIALLEDSTIVNYESQVGNSYLITACVNGGIKKGYIAYRVQGISTLRVSDH